MSPLPLHGGSRTLLGIWYTLLFYRLYQLADLFLFSLINSLFSYFYSKYTSLRYFIITISFTIKAILNRSKMNS
jgi:hypothetical protein